MPESWLLAIVSIMMADEVASASQSQPASSSQIDTNAIAEKIEQAAMRINTITATLAK